LERDRIVDAAAEVEEVAALVETFGDLLRLWLALQRLLEQQRQLRQRLEMRTRRFGRERPSDLPEVHGEQMQRHELRRERLRRRDADLGAGMRQHGALGLA